MKNNFSKIYSYNSEITRGGGTVFPSTGQHFETSQVAVSATPSENWKFVKWGGDGNGSSLNP